MATEPLSHDVARTLAILRLMAQGQTLTIDGYTFAMSEHMDIGTVMMKNGKPVLMLTPEMSLGAFHRMLTRHDIGMPIPDGRKR